jgi:N-acetylneuraminic acid mutarotase
VETDDGVAVFSFLGMDSTKVWSGVTNAAYRWDVGSPGEWRSIEHVPGPGRLAATAQVVGGRVFVLGGYTVAEDGGERSVPDVNIYDPADESWSRGADIPIPTDDAASGVWRDSLIVLVSGWHDDGNVAAVQLYDPADDSWTSATPIAGAPVFGHTGTVVGDAVVYVDGARVTAGEPRFVMDSVSWMGAIGAGDPATISWTELPEHPAPVLYRAAAGVIGDLALFVGGTDNPYNYDGMGYNGVPSAPLRQVMAFASGSGRWRWLAAPPVATMDHRTLGAAGGQIFLVGGMEEGQQVTDRVWVADVATLLARRF